MQNSTLDLWIKSILFYLGQARKYRLVSKVAWQTSQYYWIISKINQIFTHYLRLKLRSNIVKAKSEAKPPYILKNKLHKIFCNRSVDCILSGQKTCIQHVKDTNSLCHFPENSNLLVHLPWYVTDWSLRVSCRKVYQSIDLHDYRFIIKFKDLKITMWSWCVIDVRSNEKTIISDM